jgi:hypothetical protein
MSVIAKMEIEDCKSFGRTGWLTRLKCVCENDVMAEYATAHEDRLFTRYSPWGDCQLGLCLVSGVDVASLKGRKFYMITTRGNLRPPFRGAAAVLKARCVEVARTGKDQNRVEVAAAYCEDRGLNWRMSIDNPPAVAFFEPGESDYFVAFYDCERFTMDEALADAHEEPDQATSG